MECFCDIIFHYILTSDMSTLLCLKRCQNLGKVELIWKNNEVVGRKYHIITNMCTSTNSPHSKQIQFITKVSKQSKPSSCGANFGFRRLFAPSFISASIFWLDTDDPCLISYRQNILNFSYTKHWIYSLSYLDMPLCCS